ncbi:MAG: RNA-binding protein [Treponemataceae bacterium]|nr:MAG: RNA-binding protein [Treponemataceae bacterium]
MAKKIYVGNLAYSTNEENLQGLFNQYGEVVSVAVIKDRFSNQSKGFGFVEMAEDDAADAAIATLNGKEVDGRRIRVNVAENKPRDSRPRGNFGRDGGGDNYRY